jgi:hypothetical protein
VSLAGIDALGVKFGASVTATGSCFADAVSALVRSCSPMKESWCTVRDPNRFEMATRSSLGKWDLPERSLPPECAWKFRRRRSRTLRPRSSRVSALVRLSGLSLESAALFFVLLGSDVENVVKPRTGQRGRARC